MSEFDSKYKITLGNEVNGAGIVNGEFVTSADPIATALQDEETRLGTYEGYAQVLEVKEIENETNEHRCRILKYAIKSVEGLVGAEKVVEKYRTSFDLAFVTYENKANLTQLSIKTQVEVQLGLIFSGISYLKEQR